MLVCVFLDFVLTGFQSKIECFVTVHACPLPLLSLGCHGGRWGSSWTPSLGGLFSFWDLQLSLFLKLNSQVKKKWGDSNKHVKEMNKHNQTVK